MLLTRDQMITPTFQVNCSSSPLVWRVLNGDYRAATVVVLDIEQLPTSKFFFRLGAIAEL